MRNQISRTAERVPSGNSHSRRAFVWDDQAGDGLHALHFERVAKVCTELSQITLAYNLKRVLNLVTFEKMMATVA